ncbi:hypothetical protein DPEC_G00329750 [Dallia pectoralis]|uniref:Uncharacterized protein n=1 Tax=Dallia pectoralis TaxID=75939 RepID=A0ACC2F921_DALPE|nr:hypothetical protein DPEC_G00329750 [Dallia pectoralis]
MPRVDVCWFPLITFAAIHIRAFMHFYFCVLSHVGGRYGNRTTPPTSVRVTASNRCELNSKPRFDGITSR